MKKSEIVVGKTYRRWDNHNQGKWRYRKVVSIQPVEYHPDKMDVTFIQYYGTRRRDGQWWQDTTRLTSFARWAEEEAELPPGL